MEGEGRGGEAIRTAKVSLVSVQCYIECNIQLDPFVPLSVNKSQHPRRGRVNHLIAEKKQCLNNGN